MPKTLDTLLARCLDYAGLFPPASLGTEEALRRFVEERGGNEFALLSRFVCPALRVEELANIVLRSSTDLAVAVLPRGGRSAGDFLANLESDLITIQRTVQLTQGRVGIDTIEMRPPADALGVQPLRKLVAATSALVSRRAPAVRQVYFELAPGAQLAGQLEILAEEQNQSPCDAPLRLGYKLRTGGSDASAVPASAHIAMALGSAAALGLQMKCTGGLHRPLRTSDGVPVPMHGFVNLLVAAALAATVRPPVSTLETVLEETSPAAFGFAARSLTWREHKLTDKTIATTRTNLLVSFGSCYADLPRSELQNLGWWPRAASAQNTEG